VGRALTEPINLCFVLQVTCLRLKGPRSPWIRGEFGPYLYRVPVLAKRQLISKSRIRSPILLKFSASIPLASFSLSSWAPFEGLRKVLDCVAHLSAIAFMARDVPVETGGARIYAPGIGMP
jgi:hypothetical protein